MERREDVDYKAPKPKLIIFYILGDIIQTKLLFLLTLLNISFISIFSCQGGFLCVQVANNATVPQWFLLAFIRVTEHEKLLAVSIRTPGLFVHTLVYKLSFLAEFHIRYKWLHWRKSGSPQTARGGHIDTPTGPIGLKFWTEPHWENTFWVIKAIFDILIISTPTPCLTPRPKGSKNIF